MGPSWFLTGDLRILTGMRGGLAMRGGIGIFMAYLLKTACMRKWLFLLVAVGSSSFLFAQRTIIYCGKLIDPGAGQVLTAMSIVVTDNIITSVDKGYTVAAAGDKVIDLKGRTVMPG